jgi:hypothetical protein
MDATAKRATLRHLWHGRTGCLAARRAATGQPAVPTDQRLHFGQVDLVIFADHLAMRIFAKWQPAMLAMHRAMVFVRAGRFGQHAGVALVSRLATAGPRAVPLALLVRRWRLR